MSTATERFSGNGAEKLKPLFGPVEPPVIRVSETEEDETMSPLPLNALLYPVDLEDRRGIEGFRAVVQKVISDMRGVQPTIETTIVEDPDTGDMIPRISFRFEVDTMTEQQLYLLEEVAQRAYGSDVRKRKTKKGKNEPLYCYTKLEAKGRETGRIDSTFGYYFGIENGTPSRATKGIGVNRMIPKKDIASGLRQRPDRAWFTEKVITDNLGKKSTKNPYVVEIREGGLHTNDMGIRDSDGPYQTDLAEIVLYTALVLAGKDLPPAKPGLLYEIYHQMNQVGLGVATKLPGLEHQIDEIDRTLMVPLAGQDLAEAIGGNAKSIILAGQVGTGKTQVTKHFLRQELGVMMVPVNVHELKKELDDLSDKRKILPRVRAVAERVGRPIILILEDIENLADEDNDTSKKLLNELAGLYKSGFRVISSSNHLEQFNPQLLEPERLGGKIIFFGLPGENARRLILEQHLVEASKRLNLPIFDAQQIDSSLNTSRAAKEFIIDYIARQTKGFTPRYLKDLVVEAINHLMYRIYLENGKRYQLTEADLQGHSFLLEDWQRALQDALARYDIAALEREDERIRGLVDRAHAGNIGFTQRPSNPNGAHKTISA